MTNINFYHNVLNIIIKSIVIIILFTIFAGLFLATLEVPSVVRSYGLDNPIRIKTISMAPPTHRQTGAIWYDEGNDMVCVMNSSETRCIKLIIREIPK